MVLHIYCVLCVQRKDIPVHISNGQGNQICKFLSYMLTVLEISLADVFFLNTIELMFQYFIISKVFIRISMNVASVSCEMPIVSSLITLDVQGCHLQEMTI